MKKQLADIFNDPQNKSNKEEMSRIDREVLRKYFKNQAMQVFWLGQ